MLISLDTRLHAIYRAHVYLFSQADQGWDMPITMSNYFMDILEFALFTLAMFVKIILKDC